MNRKQARERAILEWDSVGFIGRVKLLQGLGYEKTKAAALARACTIPGSRPFHYLDRRSAQILKEGST